MSDLAETKMLPAGLDMGIWIESGASVWMPKQFYPSRNKVKKWAVDNDIVDSYIDARVRTVWACEDDENPEPGWYVKCLPDAEGAFECWEIR